MTQDIRLWIEDFYRENYQKLFAYAYSILRNQMDAEAAVQEAFAVACESPAALFHSENPIGWITKTVRHRALRIIDERRRTDALLVAVFETDCNRPLANTTNTDSSFCADCQSSKNSFMTV